MRLPQSSNMGVQSLGRDDINAPARAWQTKTQANNAMGNVFREISGQFVKVANAQKEVEDSLLYQQQLDQDMKQNIRLKSYMTTKPVINEDDEDIPDELRQYFKENKVNFVDGKINTSDVMDGFFTTHFKNQQNNGLEVLKPTKYRDDYINSMRPQTAQIYGEASYSAVKYKQEKLRAEAGALYKAAVDDGDEERALALIEDNVNTKRIWTPEMGLEATSQLGAQIDKGNALKVLQSDDPAVLEGLADRMFEEGNRMSLEDANTIANQANAKVGKMDAARQAAREERIADASIEQRTTFAAMMNNGEEVSVQDIRQAGMTPADEMASYALRVSLMKSDRELAAKSNPKKMQTAQIMLSNMFTPDLSLKGKAYANFNSFLTDGLIDGSIVPNDANTLRTQADKMSKISHNTEQYKQAKNEIYLTLAGATQDNIFALGDSGPAERRNAMNMMTAMHEAYANTGMAFDPMGWVKDNIETYKTTGVLNAEESLVDDKYKAFSIKDSTGFTVDIEATREKLDQQKKIGAISDQLYKDFELKLNAAENFIKLMNTPEK